VSPFDSNAADLNGDEHITIADVSSLIDYLLNPVVSVAKAWDAVPAQGGIFISNPAGEPLEVYDLDAECVAIVDSSATVELQPGIYVVASDTVSRKVVVK